MKAGYQPEDVLDGNTESAKKKTYRVEITPRAAKQIHSLDKTIRERVLKWLDRNIRDCANPRSYGEPLHGNLHGFWKYPIKGGKYRLIAIIVDEYVIIEIVFAGERDDVYEKSLRGANGKRVTAEDIKKDILAREKKKKEEEERKRTEREKLEKYEDNISYIAKINPKRK